MAITICNKEKVREYFYERAVDSLLFTTRAFHNYFIWIYIYIWTTTKHNYIGNADGIPLTISIIHIHLVTHR